MMKSKIRRCNQIKCFYYLNGNCKFCDNCKAKPYNIDTKCDVCLSCECEEGSIRFGEDNSIKVKEQLVEVM